MDACLNFSLTYFLSSFLNLGAVPVRNSFFGSGSGSILLDDVMCTGNEVSLLNCPRRSNTALFSSNCDHTEDAGVICQG